MTYLQDTNTRLSMTPIKEFKLDLPEPVTPKLAYLSMSFILLLIEDGLNTSTSVKLVLGGWTRVNVGHGIANILVPISWIYSEHLRCSEIVPSCRETFIRILTVIYAQYRVLRIHYL